MDKNNLTDKGKGEVVMVEMGQEEEELVFIVL